MLDLPLDPTDDLAQPAFHNELECAAWLQQLQLTNLHQAHGVLRSQFEELNRYPMRALERLHILEMLRETVVPVQADYAKKLFSKKLPLNNDELMIFTSITGLWQNLVSGYQRCLQAFIAGDKKLDGMGALLTQRCLRYSGLQIFEHLRAGYEFDGQKWHQLHALFAFAEQHGFHREPVDDDLHTKDTPSSCQTVYAKALLDCHANPAELSRSQLQLLDRWLNKWGHVLSVERKYSTSQNDAPPLGVDLTSTQGIQSINHLNPSGDLRYLPMVPLSKLLRVKVILLQQGQSTQQVELGSECSSSECVDFLNKLHHFFCEPNPDRKIDRHAIATSAELCFELEGIYAHIARKPFKQPGKVIGMDSLARKQIMAFGHVLSESKRQDIVQLGYITEKWLIENESILGARVLRESTEGGRVGHNHLVALKPNDANVFMLGKTSWVNVTLSGQLRIGIQYFPGLAQPVSIRRININPTQTEKAHAALLLPELPTLKIPPSLILPKDFFQADRQAEMIHLDDQHQTIRMGFSVDRGADFERISFATT